jgi:membrane protease YdiL (CAAX protease family)
VISELVVHTGLAGLSQNPHDRTVQYIDRPSGWVPVVLFMVVIAPVIEEFIFRGWIQHSLERRLGTWPAIGIAAALFAAVHADGMGAFHFGFGVLAGYFVCASDSIWTGVLLHAGNNLAVVIAGSLLPERVATPEGMIAVVGVWPLVAVAVVSGVLLFRIALTLPVRRRRPRWKWSPLSARPRAARHRIV